jgi:general secretion pathway protein D
MRNDSTVRGQDAPPAPSPEGQLRLPPGEARITADDSSNSLIIVAEPDVQRLYSRLIQSLDRRRPQVMIEARLVLIDTSDDYSLGVELSGGDREGDRRLFAFSSFGFSDVDPVNGSLSITPGTGFNGVLVDPEIADAIVRALTNHRRARVFSAPRILVNDNALGVLTSVDEVPFSSVNASNVVATTSFAGFAEAGTTIEVVPHISADDYLQLEYSVILNTFTGTGSEGIPPPRKTDEISSVVTIPDGHTVIVGGLNQNRSSRETSGIPLVENIPLIRYLGGTEEEMMARSSLFVFLRPIILRDDKFKSLKFLTDRDARCANDKGNYPRSNTVLMK